jgi:ribosome-associated protein
MRRIAITSLTLAKKAALIADTKKGDDVIVLDLRKLSNVTDFFVITSSTSSVGVKAIAEDIIHQLKKDDISVYRVEGLDGGTWVLADYGDVVVHVFLDQVRKYFDLESFWGDAPRKNFRPRAPKKARKKSKKK